MVENFKIFSGRCARLIEPIIRRAAMHMRQLPHPPGPRVGRPTRPVFCVVETLVNTASWYSLVWGPSPASSYYVDRTFSCIRRLRKWLWSTMTQKRLNAVSVCHTRQDILDNINIDHLATEFVERSQIRLNIFWLKHWLSPLRAILTFVTMKLPL